MAILSRSISLLWLAMCCHPPVTAATTLQIQVYDYAAIGPKSLRQLVGQLDDILGYAGMSVQVNVCKGDLAVACDGTVGLKIRILATDAKTMRNVRRPPLGEAFVTEAGGAYATIFLKSVQDEAAAVDAPLVVVLAHATAHEIGHLLLGTRAHTTWGLMRENWDRDDYRAMIQNRLHFTDEQARQLAGRYGRER
jgi:hypothetical protein